MRIWLLLLLLACGADSEEPVGDGPAPDDPETTEAAARVLDDEAYWFCHGDGVDADLAKEFCPLLDGQPDDFCPGLRATCEGAPPVSSSSGCNEGDGEATSNPGGGPDRPERRRPEPEACDLPESPVDGLAALVKWVVALGVALFLLVVVRVIWGFLGVDRRVPDVEPLPLPEIEQAPDLEDVPDLPSTDLLAAARAALDAGNFGEAVLLARGAALRRLGDAGKLRLHRSRTDREYARALRRDQDLHDPLREVLTAVEIHRWGGTVLDRARSEAAVTAAARILQAIAMGLLLLGLAHPTAAHAQSERYNPIGDAALQEVLERWGHDAGFRLRGLDSLDDQVDVLVLDTTWLHPEEAGWEAVRAWVEDGGVLWLGGSGGAMEAFPELGDRRPVPTGVRVVAAERLADLDLPVPTWPSGPEWVWVGHQGVDWVVLDPAADLSLPEDDEEHQDAFSPAGGAVVAAVPVGEGRVVALADPRLLWNGAFVDDGNERFVGDWLYAAQGAMGWQLGSPIRVELATTAAASNPSPAQSMLNADLLPFVLQLLLTWCLLALWKGWPFGPLRDPPEAGRLAFADHVRALGTRWFRVGASRHALAVYGGLWLQRLGASGLKQAALRAGRDKHRAEALLSAVQAAVDDPSGPSSEHDFEWMEELWTITNHR